LIDIDELLQLVELHELRDEGCGIDGIQRVLRLQLRGEQLDE
jgi:hypothetical protein